MVKLSEEMTNITKVYQVCVCIEGARIDNKNYHSPYVYVSQTIVNDMEFHTLMRISFKLL